MKLHPTGCSVVYFERYSLIGSDNY